jgi:hypothetical protein
MKSITLALVVLSLPCAIGQAQKEPLRLSEGLGRSFNADSIERQDPLGASSGAYASVFHLKGNVVIRVCCVARGLSETAPKQAMFMSGDEAVYHQDTGQIEFRGDARVSFQNYPK